jgi:hypothetical protein
VRAHDTLLLVQVQGLQRDRGRKNKSIYFSKSNNLCGKKIGRWSIKCNMKKYATVGEQILRIKYNQKNPLKISIQD